ncbi:lysophospholipid acyltransferase family protein [Streptococcus dentasini]
MFYAYLRWLVSFLVWVVNGNAHYHNRNNLLDPQENYVLVAPHRTWWDPIYLAFATKPKQFLFMAKKELFNNRIFGWWIRMCGAFPIDRDNPGQEAIKYPVQMLKKSQRSLIMFPSGSRHSTDVKGGVAVIAKMAKVKIQPAVYSGPRSFSGLLKGERIDMNFGQPIDISDVKRLNDQGIETVANRVQTAFRQLDSQNEDYNDHKKLNPLTYIYRLPLGVIAFILVILTMAFSYVASFIWNPEWHRK